MTPVSQKLLQAALNDRLPKSHSYTQGYQAYMSWAWSGSHLRPENPYQLEGDIDDVDSYKDWQDGWDDASFDV